MIEVHGLRKQYGDLVAVDDVTFTAEPGAVFGLLGPNGAGKSTTIGCISGLLSPTSGRVSVMGHDVVSDGPASRRQLGVVPQEIALYEELTARENLMYWGGAYGLAGAYLKQRVNEVLDVAGLLDRAKEPVKKFSGGMKRRLNFCVRHRTRAPRRCCSTSPPSASIRRAVSNSSSSSRIKTDAGTCVIYTTHYMEEAEQLCDRLAIIDHGEIIAAGSLRRAASR